MQRPTKVAFTDFKYVYNGEVYIFKDYEGLYAFKLIMSHWTRSPFLKLSRAFDKRKEHKLERRYNLPEGYLAGIRQRCRRPDARESLAQAKASEFHFRRLQYEIQVSLDRFLPAAIELFAKHHQIQFIFENVENEKIEDQIALYERMDGRHDQEATYQSPRYISAPGPGPNATAPPLFHEVQIHGTSGGGTL
jgi:hypothetical protein